MSCEDNYWFQELTREYRALNFIVHFYGIPVDQQLVSSKKSGNIKISMDEKLVHRNKSKYGRKDVHYIKSSSTIAHEIIIENACRTDLVIEF